MSAGRALGWMLLGGLGAVAVVALSFTSCSPVRVTVRRRETEPADLIELPPVSRSYMAAQTLRIIAKGDASLREASAALDRRDARQVLRHLGEAWVWHGQAVNQAVRYQLRDAAPTEELLVRLQAFQARAGGVLRA